jgi:hypothetical protein
MSLMPMYFEHRMLVTVKSIPDTLFRPGKRREYSEGNFGPEIS